jgi:hypothetical protein
MLRVPVGARQPIREGSAMQHARRTTSSKRRLAALIGIAGVSAVVAMASVALASGVRTRTHIYEAFTSAGTPALHVKSTVRGSCNGGSAATSRADAWRCFAGNFVYDPCFSSSAAKGIVLCPAGAWSSTGIEIKLTGRLVFGNKGKPSTSGVPWAVETTSGAKCEIATGATSVIGGRRANYYCQKSKSWLWGNPSRKAEPWTLYTAPLTATKLTRTVKLSVAWF